MTVELLPTVPIFDALWPIALAVCPRSDCERQDYGERLRRQLLRWDTFEGLREWVYTYAQSGDIRLFDARRVPVDGPAFGLSVLSEDVERLDRAFGIAPRVAKPAASNHVEPAQDLAADRHRLTVSEVAQLFSRRNPLSTLIEQAIVGAALPLSGTTLKRSIVGFLEARGVEVEHIDESDTGRGGSCTDRQIKFSWEGETVVKSDKHWSDQARYLNRLALRFREK